MAETKNTCRCDLIKTLMFDKIKVTDEELWCKFIDKDYEFMTDRGGLHMGLEEWLTDAFTIVVLCIAASFIFRKKK